MIGSMSSNPIASQTIARIAPTGRYKRLLRKLSGWYVTVQMPVSFGRTKRYEKAELSDEGEELKCDQLDSTWSRSKQLTDITLWFFRRSERRTLFF